MSTGLGLAENILQDLLISILQDLGYTKNQKAAQCLSGSSGMS